MPLWTLVVYQLVVVGGVGVVALWWGERSRLLDLQSEKVALLREVGMLHRALREARRRD